MSDPWLKRWNDRYSEEEYAFGTQPNVFLEEQLKHLSPGKILFGAEGEGRNAVFAARNGWNVHAFDISVEGKKKALQLANANNVDLIYQVGQLPDLDYDQEQFDVVALIYAHFPIEIRSDYHQLMAKLVKPGGHVILEAFGKNHLKYREANPRIGGPRDLDTLISVSELERDFKDFQPIILEEKEVQLQEGLYHNGTGWAVRFVGKKH